MEPGSCHKFLILSSAWKAMDLSQGVKRSILMEFRLHFDIMCPWVLSSFAIPNIFWLNNSYFNFLPISCCQFSIFSKLATREMVSKAKAAADGLQIFIWWGHASYLALLFPTYFDKTTPTTIFWRFLGSVSGFLGQDAADSALGGQTGLFPEISVYLPMADTPSLLLTSRTTSRVTPLKILTDPCAKRP